MREVSTMRWLRSTVEIESSCTHDRRLMAASTSSARARRQAGGEALVGDHVAAKGGE